MSELMKIMERVSELLKLYLYRSDDIKKENNDLVRRMKRVKYWDIVAERRLLQKYMREPEKNRKKLEFIEKIQSELLKKYENIEPEIEALVESELNRIEKQRGKIKKKKTDADKSWDNGKKKKGNNKKRETIRKQVKEDKMLEIIMMELNSDGIGIRSIRQIIDVLLCVGDKNACSNFPLREIKEDIQIELNAVCFYSVENCVELYSLLCNHKALREEGNRKDFKSDLAIGLLLFLDEADSNLKLSQESFSRQISKQNIGTIDILRYFLNGENAVNQLPFDSVSNYLVMDLFTSKAKGIEDICTIATVDYFLSYAPTYEYHTYDITSAELWLLTNVYPEVSYGRWTTEGIKSGIQRHKSIEFLLMNCIRDYILSPIMLEYTIDKWLIDVCEWDNYKDFLFFGDAIKCFTGANNDGINIRYANTWHSSAMIRNNQYNIGKILEEYLIYTDFFDTDSSEICSAKYNFDVMRRIYYHEGIRKIDYDKLEAYNILTGFEICVELINGLDGICAFKDTWKDYMDCLVPLIGQMSRYIKIFGRNMIYLVHAIFSIIKGYNEKHKCWVFRRSSLVDAKVVIQLITEMLYRFNIEDIAVGVFTGTLNRMGVLEIMDDYGSENLLKEKLKEKVKDYKVQDRIKKLKNEDEFSILKTSVNFEEMESCLSSTTVQTPLPYDYKPERPTKTLGRWYCVLQRLLLQELSKN